MGVLLFDRAHSAPDYNSWLSGEATSFHFFDLPSIHMVRMSFSWFCK